MFEISRLPLVRMAVTPPLRPLVNVRGITEYPMQVWLRNFLKQGYFYVVF